MATRQQRIDWLLANQHLWEGWPLGNGPTHDPRRRQIIAAMKAAGVVSANTYWQDVQLTNLITEARRQRRNKR